MPASENPGGVSHASASSGFASAFRETFLFNTVPFWGSGVPCQINQLSFLCKVVISPGGKSAAARRIDPHLQKKIHKIYELCLFVGAKNSGRVVFQKIKTKTRSCEFILKFILCGIFSAVLQESRTSCAASSMARTFSSGMASTMALQVERMCPPFPAAARMVSFTFCFTSSGLAMHMM